MRLTTVTKRADLLLLTAEDFDEVPRAVGTIRLPNVFNPNRAEYRRDVARALRQRQAPRRPARPRAPHRSAPAPTPSRPTPSCASGCGPPARPSGWSASWSSWPVASTGHNQSLAREFDRVLDVLDRRGYVDADAGR